MDLDGRPDKDDAIRTMMACPDEQWANYFRPGQAEIDGKQANARALAWARSPIGTPYGGTEAVLEAPRSGTAPDLPDQGIPRLRGGRMKRKKS
jgi:hypothetical protein